MWCVGGRGDGSASGGWNEGFGLWVSGLVTQASHGDQGGSRIRVDGRGAARAENAQGTPTQSHISPSKLVYEDQSSGVRVWFGHLLRGDSLQKCLGIQELGVGSRRG